MQLEPVVEAFFSHQGEGPTAGRLAFFVRLAGCGIGCSWCDTKFAWGKRGTMTFDQAAEVYFQRSGIRRLVLTGGEPADHLLDDDKLVSLAAFMHEVAHAGITDIEVETTGFNSQRRHITTHSLEIIGSMLGDTSLSLNLSPKLPSSGTEPHSVDSVVNVSMVAAPAVSGLMYKLAVDPDNDDDVQYVRALLAGMPPRWSIPVWLMGVTRPGQNQQQIDLAVRNLALELKLPFTLRQQVVLHGSDARGV